MEIKERKRPGRKPMPIDKKRNMVAVYLTNEEKELILSEFESVTDALRKFIIPNIKFKKAEKWI